MLQCNLLLFKLRYLRSDVRLFCFIKKANKILQKKWAVSSIPILQHNRYFYIEKNININNHLK